MSYIGNKCVCLLNHVQQNQWRLCATGRLLYC